MQIIPYQKCTILCVFILGVMTIVSDGTLSKNSGKNGKTQKTKKVSPAEKRAPDAQMTYEDILQSHSRVHYEEEKKFPNEVLGYVTPWNSHGYDVGKWLAQKFTHIAPVWFQIVPLQGSNPPTCTIAGNHDNDQGWVKDIRKNNSDVKIIPRFLFEKWSGQELRHLFAFEDEQIRCAHEVMNFIKRNNFNGAVLEVWVTVMTMSQGLASGELIHFLINWAEMFSENKLETVIPVPPPLDANDQPSNLFNAEHFGQLVPYVNYFNVMTYDFPGRKAGPVAPIDWVRKCLESLIMKRPDAKAKILMGLNFYGYDYAPMGQKVDPVVGHRFLELLKNHKPDIIWNKPAAEHYMEYSGHLLFYPSLASIEARLNLAKDLGVGVGIWEIGQGLDYFYNLF